MRSKNLLRPAYVAMAAMLISANILTSCETSNSMGGYSDTNASDSVKVKVKVQDTTRIGGYEDTSSRKPNDTRGDSMHNRPLDGSDTLGPTR